MDDRQKYLSQHGPRFLAELSAFLSIPSVSRVPAHGPDIQRAAAWLAKRLADAGVEQVQVFPTGGHPETGVDYPVVYGEWLKAPGRPTLLVYGHFDVQPAEPLEQWTSPPFEPTVRDGRVYARGASDDKGNLLIPLVAAEAFLQTTGSLPLNLKFLFEGQEEIGSPQLPAFLEANREKLGCDVALSADGGRCGDDPPGLVTGTRGGCGVQITVAGARADLHSGLFGGAVQNPFIVLAELVGTLRSASGTVLVPGFYDDVRVPSDTERALAAGSPLNDAAFAAELGLPGVIGEPDYSLVERLGSRPTLDVIRIWGEHEGTPITPIIPRLAHAHVACRLVPDQKPEAIKELLAAFIRRQPAPGATVTVRLVPGGSPAYVTPFDHPANRIAIEVLADVTGKSPWLSRLGGTVPVLNHFQRMFDAATIFFGFGRDDEHLHAPDEFLRWENFERGALATTMLYERLGALAPGRLRAGA